MARTVGRVPETRKHTIGSPLGGPFCFGGLPGAAKDVRDGSRYQADRPAFRADGAACPRDGPAERHDEPRAGRGAAPGGRGGERPLAQVRPILGRRGQGCSRRHCNHRGAPAALHGTYGARNRPHVRQVQGREAEPVGGRCEAGYGHRQHGRHAWQGSEGGRGGVPGGRARRCAGRAQAGVGAAQRPCVRGRKRHAPAPRGSRHSRPHQHDGRATRRQRPAHHARAGVDPAARTRR